MYSASGLLSQFQGLPLVSHPNHSAASTSSKAQQSIEDNSVVKGGAEVEEASECSQSTNNTIVHMIGDCRATEELNSVLKKRHGDLVSPLSEKRDEKKLEGCLWQESFSNLTNDFSRLEVMFDDCIDKNGPLPSLSPNRRNSEASCIQREKETPACGQEENEGHKSTVISQEELKSINSQCFNKITEKTTATDVGTKGGNNDATETAKEFGGVLVEHDINDLLFFSPDRSGIKNDGGIGLSGRAGGNQYSRIVDAVSKHRAILSSSYSCLSVVCSPRLSTKKDGTKFVITASLQSLSPSEKKVESSGQCVAFENNSMRRDGPLILVNVEHLERKLESSRAAQVSQVPLLIC